MVAAFIVLAFGWIYTTISNVYRNSPWEIKRWQGDGQHVYIFGAHSLCYGNVIALLLIDTEGHSSLLGFLCVIASLLQPHGSPKFTKGQLRVQIKTFLSSFRLGTQSSIPKLFQVKYVYIDLMHLFAE